MRDYKRDDARRYDDIRHFRELRLQDDERDRAEEVISDIYYRIIGESPEWSNLFGFTEAVDEIQDAFDLVRAAAKNAPASSPSASVAVPAEAMRLLESSMDNVLAWRLGEVARDAGNPERKDVGDLIDRGLILRRLLEEKGFRLIAIDALLGGTKSDLPSPPEAKEW